MSKQDQTQTENVSPTAIDDIDREWANLLSPGRRQLLGRGGLLAGGGLLASALGAGKALAQAVHGDGAAPPAGPFEVPHLPGHSPWGEHPELEATTRPSGFRPNEDPLPAKPRPYTDIKSYHAHIYFNEDNYEKAALLRKWSAERFRVEMGHWNTKPIGPHVTPSFYFGFSNEQLPVILPWLQLNNLDLTILIHPNTDDPRSDHLYYALWVNRAQPVNAFDMKKPGRGQPAVEQIYPNTHPNIKIET
ncbi:hypothetical protein AA14337_1648 [Acetobacter malorum DSM 14337]|uniref:Aromatic ring-cleaving dioxygenase n=1 Tax=Acetobacter malorum DSM 14337 TaxID=1307910 RepID=A0ABQ0PT06_9PROT|nr:DOPA 4,5-dioxygenase family protein [Acetobacter malorum]KXV04978.1 hypothetical protein AD930_15550 [Acetobacter malorum]GBQ80179.1 hypothetical protein AA14337_1648 [Acetobacter malorum DSM 14337]